MSIRTAAALEDPVVILSDLEHDLSLILEQYMDAVRDGTLNTKRAARALLMDPEFLSLMADYLAEL